MDDGLNGDFTKIYDGSNLPFNITHTVEGLVSGLPYMFKVQSENLNGNSIDSDV
jgi:hypothetical protein